MRRLMWLRLLTLLPAALVVLVAVAGPAVAPHGAEDALGIPFARPDADAWLGTDRLGRDVWSQLLYGGWGLLLIAGTIAVAVTMLSCVLGTIAALRPRVGRLIEGSSDLAILMPAVLGILLVLTSWPDAGVFGLLVVALLFGTPYCARVFAAAAAGVAASGYVESAQASGETLLHLVFREVIPNLRSVLAAQLGLRFVAAIYLVSTASFLSLPTTLGASNWAVMVRDNTSGMLLNPWSVLAPSLAIAIVAVCVNLAVSAFGQNEPATSRRFDGGGDTTVREGIVNPHVVGDTRHNPSDRASLSESAGAAVVVDQLCVRGANGQELVEPTSFQVGAGTVVAITGPSGSGKTTLMRALLGDLPSGANRSGGTVTVAGQDVFGMKPDELRRFRRERIAYVGQDPGSALNPLMRVRALLGEVARDRSERALTETLELVGLSAEHLRRRPGQLSGGQQRRVALARALVRYTDILILDEPLAGLHGALRTDIARLLTDIASNRGTTILLSGHDTATIHAIADHIVDLGHLPHRTVPPAPTGLGPPQPAKSCREPIDTAEAASNGCLGKAGSGSDLPGSEIILRAAGLTAAIDGHQVLDGIDLEVGVGAAVAVIGASGAGKTTLARVIAGLNGTATGLLELRGAAVPVGGERRNRYAGNGIQLVTQNPRSALNPRRTVAQTLGRPLRRIGGVARHQLAQRVTELLAAVELAPELATRLPHELSGGQRQRVALARALAAEPAVLICDEITSALDHRTATSIMALLDRIRADRKTALLVISHDMRLVASHCPDMIVLDHGRIAEFGRTAAILDSPGHPATHALLA